MLSEYSWNSIVRVKSLYNVVWKALDNIEQEKSYAMLS